MPFRFIIRSVALKGLFVFTGCIQLSACSAVAPYVAASPPTDIVIPEHLNGRLSYRGNCTYLMVSGSKRTLIWPHGHVWDSTAKAVKAPDGRLFKSGMQVTIRGGDGSIEFLQGDPEAYPQLQACGGPYVTSSYVEGEG